jgi:sarcosine oxidase, subunit gamma
MIRKERVNMWNEARSNPAAVAPGAEVLRQESPLIGLGGALKLGAGRAERKFWLRERAFCELVTLRGDGNDAAFAEAVARVIGCRPPVKPNTVARGTEYDVLWLGPDEWLVRSLQPQHSGLERRLAAALEGQFASAVDNSSGSTVLELGGERVRDVLARGCPLDLHPRGFAPGQCAQSHYFKASIVLLPVSGDSYEIVVRRSFADYFCTILLDAARPLIA